MISTPLWTGHSVNTFAGLENWWLTSERTALKTNRQAGRARASIWAGARGPLGRSAGRSSCRLGLDHVADPHQVVQRRGQGEQPPDPPHAAVAGLPQDATVFTQPKTLLDALPLLLTHRVHPACRVVRRIERRSPGRV